MKRLVPNLFEISYVITLMVAIVIMTRSCLTLKLVQEGLRFTTQYFSGV